MIDEVSFESLQNAETPNVVYWLDERDGEKIQIAPSKVTEWINRSNNRVNMLFRISCDPIEIGKNADGTHRYRAIPAVRVVVEPGATVRLPSSVDRGVHEEVCRHDRCSLRPMACRNPAHESDRTVMGGIGLRLTKVSGSNRPIHPVLQPGSPVAVQPTPAVGREERLAARLAGQS